MTAVTGSLSVETVVVTADLTIVMRLNITKHKIDERFPFISDVFFRKYTKKTAKRLGLVGCVNNTEDGTVKGKVQGPLEPIKEMKEWLERTGSPESKIDKCVFENEKSIPKLDYTSFIVTDY